MTRALALDLGTRRIGVAVSDAGGVLATPRTTVMRSRDRTRDHATIAALVAEEEAAVVVVGLPLSLDGGIGPAAAATLEEVEQLAAVLPVPVVTHDERFTTVTAHDQLRAAGLDGRRRAAVVDQQAAAVLLQSWLDSNR
ncbi:MAG: Holliday junction resolvase RuvX [Acidimicrobiia bacterium]|nr:Holliday junction resolvase RuvX [Acidimicrobiia bacterium]